MRTRRTRTGTKRRERGGMRERTRKRERMRGRTRKRERGGIGERTRKKTIWREG